MKTSLKLSISPGYKELAHYPYYPEHLPVGELAAKGRYTIRCARNSQELSAVLRLRFEVFNLELHEGLDSSYLSGLDQDEFDLTCHHLMVSDRQTSEVIGTYRIRTGDVARAGGGFYSASEFDLSSFNAEQLFDSVEIGRACIARAHRNKQVLYLLWKGLAAYTMFNRKRYLFGCCSITSQDPQDGLRAFNFLQQQNHLHPSVFVPPRPGLECVPSGYFIVDGQDVLLPRLFQTYLRFGAKICGPPAIDREFKTIDFFVLFDTAEMNEKTRRLFFTP